MSLFSSFFSLIKKEDIDEMVYRRIARNESEKFIFCKN